MTLTNSQIHQFRTQGFVAVSNFFSKQEVQAMQAEVERFKQDGLLRNVATDSDGKTHSSKVKNLQLCPIFPHSTLFRALPFKPEVIEAISSLIGDEIILHLDQIFLKPGGDGMGTNWHQDNAYFKIDDPMKGTAMWVAVHDATIQNGTMHMIANAFDKTLDHSRDSMSDHHIRCYPEESKEIPVEIPAGGVIFFCYGTPHCTKGNKTKKDRAGVAFHFLHVKHANKDLIDESRDRRPYLTGPKATGGKQEYGIDLRGTWNQEVEKLALQEVAR
jgi:ectoine hydroxylase-related dioxygenase (phytanoyl-CoA dioxygenase family)